MVWTFDGSLVLDPARYELRRDGRPVPMEPQAFDVLIYLVSHRERVVSKQELMDAVWGGRFVTEAAVTSRIKQVRRALGDDGQVQRLIRTVHGRGYRFVATTDDDIAGDAVDAPSHTTPPVHYTVSDGLHIAYQVTGESAAPAVGASADIVLIPGFVSHLDLDWADTRYAHFLDRLGSMGRLIRFDKRGTGMSDRPQDLPDLETRMHDVLAVMDAAGSQRAVLCGYSEGGPMAILMAATHPERVASLVLYGSYAKRTRAEDYPWADTIEQRRATADRLIDSWDWEADLRRRCPSGDADMARWWAQRIRAAATPSTIRALIEMNAAVDVRGVLGAVRVPTLVLHRRDDVLFRPEEGRYLAQHIPSATLRLLDGEDHLVCGNPDQLLDEIERFLRSTRPGPSEPLSLAAVVAVAGASTTDALHDLTAHGGLPVQTPANRTVVLFDGPATAARAALSSAHAGVRLGMSIAEVARAATTVDGPGVRHAQRIADIADEGQLWMSAAAGMLLAGSGLRLQPVAAQDDMAGLPLLRAVADGVASGDGVADQLGMSAKRL